MRSKSITGFCVRSFYGKVIQKERKLMNSKAALVIVGFMSIILCWTPIVRAYSMMPWIKARIAPFQIPFLNNEGESFRVETVALGLESPWAVVTSPDGRLFITERPGRLRVFQDSSLDLHPVRGVPQVYYEGQGGLLDMTFHPEFFHNQWIYLAYTVKAENGPMTRVSRFSLTEEGLTDDQLIFPGFPGSDKPKHFGCRIRFGLDGKLYITLGERGDGHRAQDLMDLNGKTLRLNDDGTIPKDNPFVDSHHSRQEIFSYGNRNSQGMAIQPVTGVIFQTEHGPSWNDAPGGGDEVNLIVAGGNYGWPLVHHRKSISGMISPLLEYTPAIAPAGAMFYTGDVFPAWKGNFFFTTLRGQMLVRVKLDGQKPVGQQFLLKGDYGRLRDVTQGLDGFIYVITSDTDAYGPGRPEGDRLIRLRPE
jgi:glucose/arabinose dehydrogenase